jgi:hypothetical protein
MQMQALHTHTPSKRKEERERESRRTVDTDVFNDKTKRKKRIAEKGGVLYKTNKKCQSTTTTKPTNSRNTGLQNIRQYIDMNPFPFR